MKRKDFLMISSLSAMGITLIPKLVSPAITSLNEAKLLRKNLHNRHGYFGEEFFINKIERLDKVEIKIDHFDNPEGDLIHIQINTAQESFRFAFNMEEILYDEISSIKKISYSNSKDKTLWIKKNKIALSSYSSLKDQNKSIKALIPLDYEKRSEMLMYESLIQANCKDDQLCLAFF